MTRIVLIILCLSVVFVSPLSASAEGEKEDQGYVKLPDDIERIRKDVDSFISKTKSRLQDEANQKSNVTGIQERVLVNRLDDEKILTEDDHELVLIYKVEYTYEDEATKSGIDYKHKVEDVIYSHNNLTIHLGVDLYYMKNTDYEYPEGYFPCYVYMSKYWFEAGPAYYNNRLGVKSVYREAKQVGYPYPSGSYWPLNDTSTEIFPDYTYSDSDTESHTPTNWSMIPDGLGTGYAFAFGDFSIWYYVSSPPYNSYYVENESCQPGVGGLPSS